jgi:hypothetical protein
MYRLTLALALVIFAIADIINGLLCGINDNYVEGCYHLLRGFVLGTISVVLAKD